MCEFFREKSQIVVLTTFDQHELKKKKNIFWRKFVQCARKGIFYPLSNDQRRVGQICHKVG